MNEHNAKKGGEWLRKAWPAFDLANADTKNNGEGVRSSFCSFLMET